MERSSYILPADPLVRRARRRIEPFNRLHQRLTAQRERLVMNGQNDFRPRLVHHPPRLLWNAKPEVAIFPIGAYNPWIRFHCNPEQAWGMVNEARAEVVLPVHHQTFALSREPLVEPIERFYAAAGTADQRIGWQEIGATFHWS